MKLTKPTSVPKPPPSGRSRRHAIGRQAYLSAMLAIVSYAANGQAA
jgi:hypothetical protein